MKVKRTNFLSFRMSFGGPNDFFIRKLDTTLKILLIWRLQNKTIKHPSKIHFENFTSFKNFKKKLVTLTISIS
jgi:hypothetical protein